MKTPRTVNEARKMGYVVIKLLAGRAKTRVDMQPRLYSSDMKPIISYWLTDKGLKRNCINK
jgi:hypothetical protein